ncbi:nucleolar protein NOP2 [Diaporthe amygdali]|uniref:nucleolar protein NOP2 n=1 Tax=Phomopsis amygdali TaxID=1214568 RepID=UPI0022FEDC24|nr:nucleolar protein NOP2 [Diaporthe amygdali]KAJ0119333.1 nucleolar protein NOP2 [Diaporthe amygdali]
MDFIFHVDLSTAYIVLRRDFLTSQDANGSLSSPVGAGFYYSAEAANEAARAYCSKEASKNRSFMSERAVHFEKNGLYIGGCVMRAEDRHRFEVKVRKLRARGSWGGGGSEVGFGDRRNGGLKAVEEEGERDRERERESERSETPMSSFTSEPVPDKTMPTKADRKHLDATVSAFHSQYASVWGDERWQKSLYPALAKPTRYAALVNQYVPSSEVDKVLSTGSEGELRRIQFPEFPLGEEVEMTIRPSIVALENISPDAPQATGESESREADASEKPNKQQDTFLFPPPKAIHTQPSSGKELQSHWNLDAASALCAHMLNVQPNDRVLDLCAAPGGKSVALAQLIFPHLHAGSTAPAPSNMGCLHSNEVDHARNKRLTANLRAYLPESLFESNAVRVLRLDGSDARAVTQLPCRPGGYDRVLLDAPCSSERHIIHAHVRAAAGGRVADEMARWRRGGSKTLAKLQTELLMTALKAVKVGGRVVYSTCSIETGENDGVIEKMLAAVEKDKKKFGLSWGVTFELGSKLKKKAGPMDEALENFTEETKYGRIAVPDHKDGKQWGPLFFCVITKTSGKS